MENGHHDSAELHSVPDEAGAHDIEGEQTEEERLAEWVAERLDPPPVMPWDIRFNNSVTHYVRRADGGMVLVFTPGVAAPDGSGRMMVTPPAIGVQFSAEAWERFKREVVADGKTSGITLATSIPPEPA